MAFNIVYTGHTAAVARPEVVNILARVLKGDAVAAESLVLAGSGDLIAVATQIEAELLVKRLTSAGICCELGVEEGGADDAFDTIICPRCKTEQLVARECIECQYSFVNKASARLESSREPEELKTTVFQWLRESGILSGKTVMTVALLAGAGYVQWTYDILGLNKTEPPSSAKVAVPVASPAVVMEGSPAASAQPPSTPTLDDPTLEALSKNPYADAMKSRGVDPRFVQALSKGVKSETIDQANDLQRLIDQRDAEMRARAQ